MKKTILIIAILTGALLSSNIARSQTTAKINNVEIIQSGNTFKVIFEEATPKNATNLIVKGIKGRQENTFSINGKSYKTEYLETEDMKYGFQTVSYKTAKELREAVKKFIRKELGIY